MLDDVVLLVFTPASDGFLLAIGVTVALVSEGLLFTVTLSLAVDAQRMAKRHALVRRLESVETLGSTTFICTDTTGTLTRTEMEAVEVWMPSRTVTIHGVGYAPVAQLGERVALATAPMLLLVDAVQKHRRASRRESERQRR
jgi:P-type E1-E2 ATPase